LIAAGRFRRASIRQAGQLDVLDQRSTNLPVPTIQINYIENRFQTSAKFAGDFAPGSDLDDDVVRTKPDSTPTVNPALM
jgi:hypothetical protein